MNPSQINSQVNQLSLSTQIVRFYVMINLLSGISFLKEVIF